MKTSLNQEEQYLLTLPSPHFQLTQSTHSVVFSRVGIWSLCVDAEIPLRENKPLQCPSAQTSKIFRYSPPNTDNQHLLSKTSLWWSNRPNLNMADLLESFSQWMNRSDAFTLNTRPTAARDNEITTRRAGLGFQALLWCWPKMSGKFQKPRTYHGFGEWPGQGEQQFVHPWVAMDGWEHHVSRVQCVGRDPAWGEETVQFIGEQDIAEFGSVISQHGPVVTAR